MNLTSKAVVLDELSPGEVLEMLALRSNEFVVAQDCIYPEIDELDKEMSHFIMKEEGTMVGYARFGKLDVWKIGRVVVLPTYRNKKLGRLIMDGILEEIERQDTTPNIKLSAQVYLTSFYTKLGFQVEGRMYLEDGIPHLSMVYQDQD